MRACHDLTRLLNCCNQWHQREPLLLGPAPSSSESLKMAQETGSNALVFIHSDNAVFSNASRRTARSHAATISRRRGTATKAKAKSLKDDRSVTGTSAKSTESTVCDPDDVSLSPAPHERVDVITTSASLSPATLLDTALLDPFESTALPMNRKMSGLLKGCKLYRQFNGPPFFDLEWSQILGGNCRVPFTFSATNACVLAS